MYSLESIVLILCNIPTEKVEIYNQFMDGFLIEIKEGSMLKWDIREAKQKFEELHQVSLIKSADRDKLTNYAFIKLEDYNSFFEMLGNASMDLIAYLRDKGVNLKRGKFNVYIELVIYYLSCPMMLIILLIKICKKDYKKALMFNYYNAANLSDEIYSKLLEQHCPIGFKLKGRQEVLNKTLEQEANNIEGLWLDLGCGINPLLLASNQYARREIYLLDPNEEARNAYEKYKNDYKDTKLTFVKGRGEKLPFEDNFFSLIYCGGVIAHICYLDQFIEECYRVLKPGGVILFDESNECPRKIFTKTKYTKQLDQWIREKTEVSENYIVKPPKHFVCNPWAYWGCSTDHFWIFNLEGLVELLQARFKIQKIGAIDSYLHNNGLCEGFPISMPLDLGKHLNRFVSFKNLPKWYIKMINVIFKDLGLYIYTVCKK